MIVLLLMQSCVGLAEVHVHLKCKNELILVVHKTGVEHLPTIGSCAKDQ